MNDSPATESAAIETATRVLGMSGTAWIVVAVVAGTLGLWLLLPPAGTKRRLAGMVLMITALCVLGVSQISPLSSPQTPLSSPQTPLSGRVSEAMFAVLAGLVVVSAISTITFRNPVYCAIWFAITLLGIAGLLLVDGAQFLGVATVVVYAGAILVMFLFVLMLANPSGRAAYDRLSWEPWIAAPVGVLLVAIVSLSFNGAFKEPSSLPPPPTTDALTDGVLAEQHVANLGNHLFSEYLIGIEIAGTLLLVALVAAAAIVARVPDETTTQPTESTGAAP
jgi:NADH-quinone oxidoreductase subunit J